MSDGCSKSHLEMVRLVRFRTVSDKFLYMIGKRMRFLIDMYVSWRLNMQWLWRILLRNYSFSSFFALFLVFLVWFQLCCRLRDAPFHLRYQFNMGKRYPWVSHCKIGTARRKKKKTVRGENTFSNAQFPRYDFWPSPEFVMALMNGGSYQKTTKTPFLSSTVHSVSKTTITTLKNMSNTH